MIEQIERSCFLVGVAVRSCFVVFEVVCFKGSYSMVLLLVKGSSVKTWTNGIDDGQVLLRLVDEVVCNLGSYDWDANTRQVLLRDVRSSVLL